jgi:hypothetical protein
VLSRGLDISEKSVSRQFVVASVHSRSAGEASDRIRDKPVLRSKSVCVCHVYSIDVIEQTKHMSVPLPSGGENMETLYSMALFMYPANVKFLIFGLKAMAKFSASKDRSAPWY